MNESILQQFNCCVSCYFIAFFTVFLTLFMSSPSSLKKLESPLLFVYACLKLLCILRRIREEFRGKEKKLCMCFVDLKKTFDRVPRKVAEWALRKNDCQKCWCKQ